ncbi:MAG TPA: FG-GAP-like repeat-containing protein [Bryobacteraceae bacterium]|nr:FG-GAP-like repeat-containing protein [Bryobacteraceae bacterium]
MTAASRACALTIAFTLCAGSQEEDRRASTVQRWTDGITDVSGLAALTPFSRVPYDDQDLQSICSMKQTVVADALQASTDYLAHLKSAAEPRRNYPEIMKLHHQLGQLAMYRGDVKEAIVNFEAAYGLATKLKLPDFVQSLVEKLAIAHLRRGEVENCMHHRNATSCILPISPEARHRLPDGSQRAIALFRQVLREDPSNLPMRWLLNIAYMTLGEYPRHVPAQHLIPPAAFTAKAGIGRFVDVSAATGLDTSNMAGGVIVEDFDQDGFLDIVTSTQDSCRPLQYRRSNGDGTYADRTKMAGLGSQLGGLNLISTDYNNDGRPDIFVLRGGWEFPMRNSLLRNNGNGTFSDVTREAGLAAPATASQTAAWADFDHDGHLDVFVGNEFSPSQLFRNKGDGTFEDVAAKAGVARIAFTKGAAWADYDNDGYPDLYVSNFGEENFLYHNNGDGTFSEVAAGMGVDKPIYSFPVWFMDYDNDGWQDLFVSGYVQSLADVARGYLGEEPKGETFKVYRNEKGKFVDVTKQVGMFRNALTMGCNFGDLDNDGYLDFYLGTGGPSYGALVPNLLFRNDNGRFFADVTFSAGVGHLQKGHGIAFADLDNDGNQDLFLHSGGAVPGDAYPNSVFANPGNRNRWIEVSLTGVKTNRAAIGARIKVVLTNGREIHRVVTTGTSFGTSSLRQHIGLGKEGSIQTMEIYWPSSRTTQLFQNLQPNQSIGITEFAKTFRVAPRRRFDLLAAGRRPVQ